MEDCARKVTNVTHLTFPQSLCTVLIHTNDYAFYTFGIYHRPIEEFLTGMIIWINIVNTSDTLYRLSDYIVLCHFP